MTQEKIDAAIEGALAAPAAWGALLLKAAFGGVRSALDLSIGVAGVMEAAAKPARGPRQRAASGRDQGAPLTQRRLA